jgi:hypothetical protein
VQPHRLPVFAAVDPERTSRMPVIRAIPVASIAGTTEIGVTRATLYAPSADTAEILHFLDDVTPLVDGKDAD